MSIAAQQITSTFTQDGTLTVQISSLDMPDPVGTQIVIQVEAAPVNPTDMNLLFGPSDLSDAVFSDGKISVPQKPAVQQAMVSRMGKAIPVGSECAGTVIAAGGEAQDLLGKKVSVVPGGAFATHVLTDARMAIVWPDDVNIANASAAFINPMTALGFIETARSEGHNAIVHTVGASNLGQMLLRLCRADGIDLVNMVRKPDQKKLLLDLGASHVIDTSDKDFFDQLVAGIDSTGAMIGFDPIGGGSTINTLFQAMETVAAKGMEYSRYGSAIDKTIYVYGALDISPRIMTLSYGFAWSLSGWLVMNFLAKAAPEVRQRMQARVAAELDTTFASHFKQQISLADMLREDIARAYNAKVTGEKYLLIP
ncbi:MAG: NADH oxidase [Sphingomonadaceae bacterium]